MQTYGYLPEVGFQIHSQFLVRYSTVFVLKIRNKRESNDGKPQTKSQMTDRKMKNLIKDIQYQYGSVKLSYGDDLN